MLPHASALVAAINLIRSRRLLAVDVDSFPFLTAVATLVMTNHRTPEWWYKLLSLMGSR